MEIYNPVIGRKWCENLLIIAGFVFYDEGILLYDY